MYSRFKIICSLSLALFLGHETYCATVADTSAPAASFAGPSYEEWMMACRKLPSNRSLRGRVPAKDVLPLKEFRDFESVLVAFQEQAKSSALRDTNRWVGVPPEKSFFNTAAAYFERPPAGGSPVKFQPFAQKLSVPAGSEVFFRGDLHGDVRSLLDDLAWLNEQKFLEGFRIARTNFYMVFLGDFTDRGMYGTEALYSLFRLKFANPERVFLARGNHEDLSLQLRYGYFQEGRAKYGSAFNLGKVARCYDFLPVVIYLESGGNVIQCNHGGLEPGFDPRSLISAGEKKTFQLIGSIRQQDFLSANPLWPGESDRSARDLARRSLRNFEPEEPTAPSVLGFMWNDFTILSGEAQFTVDPARAFIFGQRATEQILTAGSTRDFKLQAVFRAHQHSSVLNPMMRRLVASRGVHRHWQSTDSPALLNATPSDLAERLERGTERPVRSGSVWTFNVGPDSAYGEGCGFSFDSFGILKTASDFSDWRIRIVNVGPGS